MSYVFNFSSSKVRANPGALLLDFPRVPMLDETNIELTYKANKGVIEAFDPRFNATWTFDGPGVGKKTKTVETLRDKLLSEVTFKMNVDGKMLKFTLDGTETNPNGSHPELTLDLFFNNELGDIDGGADRFIGSDFDDIISSGTGDDVVFGGKGDDSLRGGTGEDILYGGAGSDRMSSNGAAKIYGGAGDDDLSGGNTGIKLFGGNGNDKMVGTTDFMFGGKGADEMTGSYGDDRLRGGGGADEIRGDDGDDVLKGQGGKDMLYGGSDNDILYGGGGADRMDGDAGDDVIYGGKGKDTLFVDDGFDTAFGGAGSDLLIVSDGEHILYGGGGEDLFSFRLDSFADAQKAVIKDFEDGVDQVRFDAEFPDKITTPDDFRTVKDTAKGLKLVTEDGWEVFLEGMKARDFSAADISVSDF